MQGNTGANLRIGVRNDIKFNEDDEVIVNNDWRRRGSLGFGGYSSYRNYYMLFDSEEQIRRLRSRLDAVAAAISVSGVTVDITGQEARVDREAKKIILPETLASYGGDRERMFQILKYVLFSEAGKLADSLHYKEAFSKPLMPRDVLHALMEDARIERRQMQNFPGVVEEFTYARDGAVEQAQIMGQINKLVDALVSVQLEGLNRTYNKTLKGYNSYVPANEEVAKALPVLRPLIEQIIECDDKEEAARLNDKLYAKLKELVDFDEESDSQDLQPPPDSSDQKKQEGAGKGGSGSKSKSESEQDEEEKEDGDGDSDSESVAGGGGMSLEKLFDKELASMANAIKRAGVGDEPSGCIGMDGSEKANLQLDRLCWPQMTWDWNVYPRKKDEALMKWKGSRKQVVAFIDVKAACK